MKILVIQNKMGIGDMVIYLPFIEAISKRFNTPVNILVKESSKAEQFLKDNNIINKIIILDRSNKLKNGKHDGLTGFFNLLRDIKKHNFDKVFIFNSSFRFSLIARIAGIKDIHQYSLIKKRNQHVIGAAKELLKKNLNLNVESDPKISINNQSVQEVRTKYKINNNKKNILLGIGGSGSTKRIPARIYIKLMRLITQKYKCKFFLATGKNNQEQEILKEKWDKIFFTGSTRVGKIIYKAAAESLTPVTLELGGKSPTFVLADCNIKITARRIVWAKFLNAGQTCIAPDYLIVEKKIKDQLLLALKKEIENAYPNNKEVQENYVQIVNERNFNRLEQLIPTEKIYHGGETNKENRSISPTLLHNINYDDSIMQDEIFGPILPVISFENLEDVIGKIKEREKPLSLYIYSDYIL